MENWLIEIVTVKKADPRYKVLILLPDWQEEMFESLMSDVNKAVYLEVWHLLRIKLFKIRNKLYNPIVQKK